MSDDRLEKAARALRASAATFTSPVDLYVEKESMYRWEKEHPDGEWYDQDQSRDELVDWKLLVAPVLKALDGE